MSNTTKKNEIEVQNVNTSVTVPVNTLGLTGLEEVSSPENFNPTYLFLAQEKIDGRPGSEPGYLGDTLHWNFTDITRDTGTPFPFSVITVTSVYEELAPLMERGFVKDIADKKPIAIHSPNSPLVSTALVKKNSGPQGTLITQGSDGKETLLRQVMKMIIRNTDDGKIYFLTLRKSKVFKFGRELITKLRDLVGTSSNHISLFKFNLYSTKVKGNSNSVYWNFEADHEGTVTPEQYAENLEFAAQALKYKYTVEEINELDD